MEAVAQVRDRGPSLSNLPTPTDVARGADIELAPRRWSTGRVRDRVGVLSNADDFATASMQSGSQPLLQLGT